MRGIALAFLLPMPDAGLLAWSYSCSSMMGNDPPDRGFPTCRLMRTFTATPMIPQGIE